MLCEVEPLSFVAKMIIRDIGGQPLANRLRAESQILIELAEDMASADRLVTYNGRGFDMPVLAHRATVCGVDWRHWYRPPHQRTAESRARFPHWKDRDPFPWHFDILDQQGDYGASRGWKLSDVAQSYGLPGKVGCDGSDVGNLWDNGLVKTIRRYCANDVFMTWAVFVKKWAAMADPQFAVHWQRSIDWAKADKTIGEIYRTWYAEAA